MPRLVLIFGRDYSDLTPRELRKIREAFGADVTIERIDAKDPESYAAECTERAPAAVILPELPVYHAALGHITHLSLRGGVASRVELAHVLGMNYRFGFAYPYSADLSKAAYFNFKPWQ